MEEEQERWETQRVTHFLISKKEESKRCHQYGLRVKGVAANHRIWAWECYASHAHVLCGTITGAKSQA